MQFYGQYIHPNNDCTFMELIKEKTFSGKNEYIIQNLDFDTTYYVHFAMASSHQFTINILQSADKKNIITTITNNINNGNFLIHSYSTNNKLLISSDDKNNKFGIYVQVYKLKPIPLFENNFDNNEKIIKKLKITPTNPSYPYYVSLNNGTYKLNAENSFKEIIGDIHSIKIATQKEYTLDYIYEII